MEVEIAVARKVISLSLPEELWDRLDAHYILTGYASLSEYIRELVRNDLRLNSQEPDDAGGWNPRGSKVKPRKYDPYSPR